MKTMSVLLTTLLFVVSAPALAAAENRQISSAKEAVGCWERINFTPKFEKTINPTEYFPGNYQWYCFDKDGKFSNMNSTHYSPQTEKGLRDTLNKVPQVFKYSLLNKGVILTETVEGQPKQTIPWGVVFTTEDKTGADGTPIPKGSMIMGILHPDNGQVIYWRYLKRVK